MPEISRFYGIIIKMFFDDHQPPHFHVEYNEHRAIITIEDGIVQGSLPIRALSLVFEWLDLHKEELQNNWKLMEKDEPMLKIKPLG